jgi:hypothetical protein
MGLLRWVEADIGTSKPFLKAEIVNLHLNFIDLCEGRFWGGSEFNFQLKFSIHERIVKNNGFDYQLLAPNGIHIYCKDVEEAKELAEVMYRRILGALSEQINRKPDTEQLPEGELARRLQEGLRMSRMTTEQFNRVMWKRHCKLKKFKTRELSAFLEKRGIVGRVWYSRLRGMNGWMFSYKGGDPQLLGSNYEQALDFIQSGTLDFLKEEASAEAPIEEIINLGEVG